MNKLLNILAIITAVALLAGCTPSNIVSETTGGTYPDGAAITDISAAPTTKFTPITHEYVIPEGATDPGDVTLYGDEYDNYPEDKKPVSAETPVIQVRYFYIGPEGLMGDFDVIEGSECTVEDLIKLLVEGGCLKKGTEVESVVIDESSAEVTLNQLKGQYVKATEEELAQAVANTLCDNLFLDFVTVKCGDRTYGPLDYMD